MTPRRENYEAYYVDIIDAQEEGSLLMLKELVLSEDESRVNEDERMVLVRMIQRKLNHWNLQHNITP